MSTKNRLDTDEELKEGRFPAIKVVETESGHVSVWCDTSGATYILHAHQSGSYQLFSHDGKRVEFAVGDYQQYAKQGMSLTVDENMDTKIHGHQRIIVGGGSFVEVKGDAGVGVLGDTTLVCGGNMNADADNIYLGARGNLNLNVKGNMSTKVEGNQTTEVSGETTHTTADDHTIVASKIKMNP
jgi:hypothetical protein